MKYKGVVDWFNKNKGFGFIVSDSFDEKVFVHYTSIKKEMKSLNEGDYVVFNVKTEKGLEATEVGVVNNNRSKTKSKVDFNERLLKEIARLRGLEKLNINSERVALSLDLLRRIRNTELKITFKQGIEQEDQWIKEKINSLKTF